MKEELLVVGGGLAILDSKEAPPEHASLGDGPVRPRAWICAAADDFRQVDRYQAIAERLLIGDRAPDIADLAQRQPVSSLLKDATNRLHALGIEPMQADVEAHYRWIEGVAQAATAAPSRGLGIPPEHSRANGSADPAQARKTLEYEAPQRHLTEKVDAILITDSGV
jgi:hypothetical protein